MVTRPWDDAAFLRSVWIVPPETEAEMLAREQHRINRARGFVGALAFSLFLFGLLWFGAAL